MNYYQQPFPPISGGFVPLQPVQDTYNPYSEQSYIENILRDNLNKVATVYMNFENSEWGSKIFKGILKGAGKDHIILKDIQSDTRYLLLTVYLSYITFEERIEYDYPYNNRKEE